MVLLVALLAASAATAATTPAQYRAKVNGICRGYTPRLKALETAMTKAEKAKDGLALGVALGKFLVYGLAQDLQVEAVPVPAALRTQMAPILALMKKIDTHVRAALQRAVAKDGAGHVGSAQCDLDAREAAQRKARRGRPARLRLEPVLARTSPILNLGPPTLLRSRAGASANTAGPAAGVEGARRPVLRAPAAPSTAADATKAKQMSDEFGRRRCGFGRVPRRWKSRTASDGSPRRASTPGRLRFRAEPPACSMSPCPTAAQRQPL